MGRMPTWPGFRSALTLDRHASSPRQACGFDFQGPLAQRASAVRCRSPAGARRRARVPRAEPCLLHFRFMPPARGPCFRFVVRVQSSAARIQFGPAMLEWPAFSSSCKDPAARSRSTPPARFEDRPRQKKRELTAVETPPTPWN
ncbi:hypothetical protein PaG_05865 [Moesziomyces aphidis]|uniref:Uncharacterized protein n=1 Tax=Moesziomyces aphidis TaxID=84754 RepID=W3VEF7_MOEAP|nr:hypothetical protein PaG_05865 [Moesziomyces aphidis]